MKKVIAITAFLALAASFSAMADPSDSHHPTASTDPPLEFLKSLAGTWVVASGPEEMPGDSDWEFRITTGGHAFLHAGQSASHGRFQARRERLVELRL